jgi:asparagine synthase (glutamine-hydrolysing)
MEPGTVRVYRDGKLGRHACRAAFENEERPAVDTREAGRKLASLLEDAVRLALVSDVPLGIFSSGGLDSSLVCAFASRFKPDPLCTFSVGFHERSYDERVHARSVSGMFHTVHREIVVDGKAFADGLPLALWHHDEPLNHANSVLLRALSAFAREHVTVVLTGEGSDELFGGYPRYRGAGARDPAPGGAWPERALSAVLRGRGRKTRMLAACLGKSDAYAVVSNARYVLDEDVAGLLDGDYLAERLLRVPAGSSLSLRTQAYDQTTYLHNVLQRMDRMSMSVGLEARVPFLDPRIIAFADTLAPHVKMPFLTTKAVVKEAARDVLPRSVVDRSKSGLGVPLAAWMRDRNALGPYVEMLRDVRTQERGWWDRRRLLQIVTEHERGADRSEVLWSLLNCELWARLLLDGERPISRTEAAPLVGVGSPAPS